MNKDSRKCYVDSDMFDKEIAVYIVNSDSDIV